MVETRGGTPAAGEEDRSGLFRELEKREAQHALLAEAPLPTRLRHEPIKDNRLRLHRVLRRARVGGAAVEVNARLFTGQQMRVVLPEVVGMVLYRFGFWESELTRVLLARLVRGMVFVDVGAQYGYFSLLASRLVGRQGGVVAFEPTRRTCDLLRRNVASEPNVKVENTAAYNVRATLPMLDFGPHFSAFNTLRAQPNVPDWLQLYLKDELRPVEHEVEALPLDDYFADRDARLDFVKIDAEAADYQVLEGMTGILTRQSPMVAIEAGDFEIEGAVPTSESIRFMRKLGYRCLEFQDGQLVPHRTQKTHDFGTLYFEKR